MNHLLEDGLEFGLNLERLLRGELVPEMGRVEGVEGGESHGKTSHSAAREINSATAAGVNLAELRGGRSEASVVAARGICKMMLLR